MQDPKNHQQFAIWAPSHNFGGLYLHNLGKYRQSEKNLLNSNVFYTCCGPSANSECRSEMCCMRLAGNAGPKKSPTIRHLSTIAQLWRATSSQLRHVSTVGKNLLNSNVSPTCLYNMVNFSPLAAETVSLVWGTPANVNGFRVLTTLLHSTLVVVGISQSLQH